MGWIFLAVPLLVVFFGVLWLVSGLGHVARGNAGKGSRGFVGGGVLTLAGLAASLLGINIQSYARLTHEGPVAEVSVKNLDPSKNLYLVSVRRLDGSAPVQTCQIQGDEWLISGRVQRWKPWANVLGLDSTYSLNQISNLYRSAARANGKAITACDLTGPAPQANQYAPSGVLNWLIGQSYVEDRRFGDANYMPLADGAVYKVVITQFGFNTEPENPQAHAANQAEH